MSDKFTDAERANRAEQIGKAISLLSKLYHSDDPFMLVAVAPNVQRPTMTGQYFGARGQTVHVAWSVCADDVLALMGATTNAIAEFGRKSLGQAQEAAPQPQTEKASDHYEDMLKRASDSKPSKKKKRGRK